MGLIDINKHYFRQTMDIKNEITKSCEMDVRSNDSIEIIISSKLIFIYCFKYLVTVFIFFKQ